MKIIFPFCGALMMLAGTSCLLRADDQPVYLDKNAPLEKRVNDLFARLTPDEKLSLLTGATISSTTAIPRLQVPLLRMADAGAGVRGIDKPNSGPATLFTCGVMMGSTWNPELVGRAAAAIGEEAHNKKSGTQMELGPAVNIQRSPLGGRNGEYFSEDPYLAARMTVDYIRGIQGVGTSACLKHYVANNEEVDRQSVDVQVSERALREIYFPAFAAGVQEGHAWAVMSSYNRVNGPHVSASRYLLTDVLKKGWGFDGMIVSDWGGVHQIAATINAGNDLEMPGPRLRTPANVKLALQNGQTSWAPIDDSVKRILRTIIRTGLLDGPWKIDPAMVNSPAHQTIARELAEEGIVLLKNQDHLLPLDPAKIHSIAVIGPAAARLQMGAQGSPNVTPFFSVSPVQGITKRVGGAVTVNAVPDEVFGPISVVPSTVLSPGGNPAVHGLAGKYYDNPDLAGKPVATRRDPTLDFDWTGHPVGLPGIGPDNFSVRWTGQIMAPATGTYLFSFTADDGCRLWVDGKKIIDHWTESGPEAQKGYAQLDAGKWHSIRAEYFQETGGAVARLEWQMSQDQRPKEIEAARKSDVAIVVVTTRGTESEGRDRPSMSLPNDQDALVQAVAAVNKRTIVVLNNGTPVDMRPWIGQVPGLLESWFPGQDGGTAIAEILFGDVNPSGKLPTTLGARREDYPDDGNFPGVKNRVAYREGIYVGYRHFDQANIAPLFPFGYGLSYTTFAYGPLQLSSQTLAADGTLSVSLPVTNTGARAGREVVELYIHDPAPKIDKAVRELKGFAKIDLAPGETKTVTLPITPRDLAYFDVPGRQWKADAGDYEIQVGTSSRDIRRKASVRLAATYTDPVPLSVDQLALNGGFDAAKHDLAANHPAQASSAQPNHGPDKAVDDNDITRWTSEVGSPQWLMVDLGKPETIDHVRLFWGDGYALDYSVQVSGDGQAWRDVAATTKGLGDVEWVRFPATQARWVRVLGTKTGSVGNFYSIDSFEVYGPDGAAASNP